MHNEFCDLIQNKIWCTKLAYLADLFEHLNKLNTSMHGKRENVLTSVDRICAKRDKITIRIRKVKESNFESFLKTAECELKNDISLLIIDHLILLQNKINNYFPNLEIQPSLVEEELAEIKNDRSLYMMSKESDLDRF